MATSRFFNTLILFTLYSTFALPYTLASAEKSSPADQQLPELERALATAEAKAGKTSSTLLQPLSNLIDSEELAVGRALEFMERGLEIAERLNDPAATPSQEEREFVAVVRRQLAKIKNQAEVKPDDEISNAVLKKERKLLRRLRGVEERELRSDVTAAEREHGANSWEVLEALVKFAEHLEDRQDRKGWFDGLGDALSAFARLFGVTSPQSSERQVLGAVAFLEEKPDAAQQARLVIAIPIRRRIVDIVRRLPGAAPHQVTVALIALADALDGSSKVANPEAEALLLEAITITKKASGPGSPAPDESKIDYAFLPLETYYKRNGATEARQKLKARHKQTTEQTIIAEIAKIDGSAEGAAREKAAALINRLEALATLYDAPKDDDNSESSTPANADARARAEIAKAVPIRRRLLNLRETASELDNDGVVVALLNLAQDLTQAQDGANTEALELLNRAALIREKEVPQDDKALSDATRSVQNLVTVLQSIADYHERNRQDSAVIAIFERKLALRSRLLKAMADDAEGSQSVFQDLLSDFEGLAEYYSRRGNYPAAMATLGRALVLADQHLDREGARQIISVLEKISNEKDENKSFDALRRQAFETVWPSWQETHARLETKFTALERELGVTSPALIPALKVLVDHLKWRVNFTQHHDEHDWRRKATPLLKRIAELTDASKGATSKEAINAWQVLIGNYMELKDEPGPALAGALHLLEIEERLLGPNNPKLVKAVNRVAEAYAANFRLADALVFDRRALALSAPPEQSPDGSKADEEVAVEQDVDDEPSGLSAEPLERISKRLKELGLHGERLAALVQELKVTIAKEDAAANKKALVRDVDDEPAEIESTDSDARRGFFDDYDSPPSVKLQREIAELHILLGNQALAQKFYEDALQREPRVPGKDGRSLTMLELARMQVSRGNYAGATATYKQVLKEAKEEPSGDTVAFYRLNARTGAALSGLAAIADLENRPKDAVAGYQNALLSLAQKSAGIAGVIEQLEIQALLSRLMTRQGQPEEALKVLQAKGSVLDELQTKGIAFGPGKIPFLDAELGRVHLARHDWMTASKYLAAAMGWATARQEDQLWIFKHVVRFDDARWRGEQFGDFSFAKAAFIQALYRALGDRPIGTDRPELQGAFYATLDLHQSSAGEALSMMATRASSGDPEFVRLVRERQDLANEEKALAKSLANLSRNGEPPKEAEAQRQRDLDRRIAEIDAAVDKHYPKYADLIRPKNLGLEDVMKDLLAPGEALIVIVDAPARPGVPDETYVWAVTGKTARLVRARLTPSEIRGHVDALRCGLDRAAWHEEGKQRCNRLLKLADGGEPGRILPFDLDHAHALYKGLFSEVEDLMTGRQLLYVPTGALTTLPAQVLVTKPPLSNDLKTAAWLIRDHAITVLPTIRSLYSLRRIGTASLAKKAMIGFANPLLDGNQADKKYGEYYKERANAARSIQGCSSKPVQRTAELRVALNSPVSVRHADGIANLKHLRIQSPLPETADEICDVARSVDADLSEMRIGALATETEVKRLSQSGELAQYQVLHFATHGVLAGQIAGTEEPGLILTPPEAATAIDDGYLSASEIAGLKLDADWVILSACNTAGGASGGKAAEALSGLARAFFYAQARALLVSHWAVDSAATVKLITASIGALTKEKALGRSEALRRGMLAIMADRSRSPEATPAYHPAVWAPFVVVGEGGGGF